VFSNSIPLALRWPDDDFGDDWQHVLVHEGFESADDDTRYPRRSET
jgi:hypothetical protein